MYVYMLDVNVYNNNNNEADNFQHQKMKDLLSVEYKSRVRKLLRTRLFSRNLITAINVLVVSLMRCSGEIIKWSQEVLNKLDARTRKLMGMHGSILMNSDVDRLYVPRKFSGRGLVSVSFAIQHERRNLSFYVHNSTDELLMLVAKNFEGFQENGRCYKQSVMTGHVASLRDKPLHGQFLREITDKICVKSQWLWLRKSKEMEGLSFAAQELTNSI